MDWCFGAEAQNRSPKINSPSQSTPPIKDYCWPVTTHPKTSCFGGCESLELIFVWIYPFRNCVSSFERGWGEGGGAEKPLRIKPWFAPQAAWTLQSLLAFPLPGPKSRRQKGRSFGEPQVAQVGLGYVLAAYSADPTLRRENRDSAFLLEKEMDFRVFNVGSCLVRVPFSCWFRRKSTGTPSVCEPPLCHMPRQALIWSFTAVRRFVMEQSAKPASKSK